MDTDNTKIFSNPNLIDKTAEDFMNALLAVEQTGIPKKHREMLMAHYRAEYRGEKHAISTGQLAKEVDYPNHNTANMQYGTLAHGIADELKVDLQPAPDKKIHWWRVLAIGRNVDPEPYLWIMRPQLIQALQKLNWV